MLPGWDADPQVLAGGLVQLGRAPGMRARGAWGARGARAGRGVAGVQQAGLGELVQVEGGKLAGDPGRGRGLFSGDRTAGGADELIQPAADFVAEQGHRPHRRVGGRLTARGIGHHGVSITPAPGS